MTTKTTLPLSFFIMVITKNYSPFNSQTSWHNLVEMLRATVKRNLYINQVILRCGALSLNIDYNAVMIDCLLKINQRSGTVISIKCECNYSKYSHFLTI